MKDFELYQGVYCGLCKRIKKQYGLFATASLSYDFTFLSLVGMALSQECSGFEKGRCTVNPLKKKTCARPNDAVDFAAAAAMILFYSKVKDNIHDSGFLKRLLYLMTLPFASRYAKKARKRQSEVFEIAKQTLSAQDTLEAQHEKSLDRAADPSASALGKIFALLGQNAAQKETLYAFGYQTGRYVYFCDALDDLAQDLQNGNYNPFALRFDLMRNPEAHAEATACAKEQIQMTIGEIAKQYCALELKKFEPILSNIIYLGMPQTLHEIGLPAKKRKKEA